MEVGNYGLSIWMREISEKKSSTKLTWTGIEPGFAAWVLLIDDSIEDKIS